MPLSPEAAPDPLLRGLHLLAVEDDFLLLLELEALLLEAGANEVQVCRTLDEALAAADAAHIDAAILDMRIGKQTATAVAAKLAARGTPFVFYTGQVAREDDLAQWTDTKIISKPAAADVIVHAVAELVRARH